MAFWKTKRQNGFHLFTYLFINFFWAVGGGTFDIFWTKSSYLRRAMVLTERNEKSFFLSLTMDKIQLIFTNSFRTLLFCNCENILKTDSKLTVRYGRGLK